MRRIALVRDGEAVRVRWSGRAAVGRVEVADRAAVVDRSTTLDAPGDGEQLAAIAEGCLAGAARGADGVAVTFGPGAGWLPVECAESGRGPIGLVGPVARWLGPPPPSVARGRLVVLAGATTQSTLWRARFQAEVDDLLAALGAALGERLVVLPAPDSPEALRATLAGEPVDLLFLVGHGERRGDDAAVQVGAAGWITGAELAAALAAHPPGRTVVALSACAAVGPTAQGDGLPGHLLRAGAAAVVGAAWPVVVADGATFVAAWARAVAAGDTIAAATTAGRRALRAQRPDRWRWASWWCWGGAARLVEPRVAAAGLGPIATGS